ncbi:MAG: hypothetical protein EPO42_04095 [Gallionellaceae bacterium]|nr:MAG: hypothetical protein EPO42_04095 [Gallionellaceae bacterium]
MKKIGVAFGFGTPPIIAGISLLEPKDNAPDNKNSVAISAKAPSGISASNKGSAPVKPGTPPSQYLSAQTSGGSNLVSFLKGSLKLMDTEK